MTHDSLHPARTAPTPNPRLQTLERLVGTWTMSSDTRGTVTYEWAPGGFFLLQHVHFEQAGQSTRGLEVIGHQHRYGQSPSPDIHSRFYSFSDGMTLDDVYELRGEALTIWSGERNSPAYYRGIFSSDGEILDGRWIFPGGGGYVSTATRVQR